MGWGGLAIGSTVLGGLMSASGQVDQGQAQRDAGYAQAEQYELEAAQVRQAAKEQAAKIRRAGNITRSAARAAYGASGVSLDMGTPITVDDGIAQDAESDAYAAILSGNRQAKNLGLQAENARRQGAFASSSSSPIGSLLSTAGSIFGIWRGMK